MRARAIAVGAALAGFIGLAAPYWSTYLGRGGGLFLDYHMGGISFLMVLVAVLFNGLLARLRRSMAFSADELLFVTAMLFAGGAIAVGGGVTHLIPMLSTAIYHSTPGNQWVSEIAPHIRNWMMPLDPDGGAVAIKRFWEGLPPGGHIPWEQWVTPLTRWGIYLMALFGCTAAIMSVMRKQWVDYEHLSFPIAQVPSELCRGVAEPGNPDSILRSRAFWIGAGIILLHALVMRLGRYAGFFGPATMGTWVTFAEGWRMRFWVDFTVIGLVFLIPNRIAFSVWVLAVVSWFVRSFVKTHNLGLQVYMPYGGPAETQHMAMGALLVLVFSSLWYGRRHLLRAVRCALRWGEAGYDSNEPTSYTAAFATGLVGAIVAGVWLWRSGMTPLYSAAFLLLHLCVYYGITRIIAQVGLPSASSPAAAGTYLTNTLGGATLGRQQVVATGMQFWNADYRNTAMTGAAHGMYVARRRRGLFAAMLFAIFVTYLSASLSAVWVGYAHGALNLSSWFYINAPRVPWWWAGGVLSRNDGPNVLGMLWAGGGAAVMAFLTLAHRSFFWWPVHPIAFVIANTHMVINFWFSIFLAWLLKAGLVKLGGQAIYRSARRFFIGVVLAGFFADGTHAVIASIDAYLKPPVGF